MLAPRVALRYLRKRLVAYFAVLAVALSVAAFYVIMSVLDGFRLRWEEMLSSSQPHVLVRTPYVEGIPSREADAILRRARATPGARAATPMLSQGVVVSAYGKSLMDLVFGIDLEAERKARTLADLFYVRPSEKGKPKPPRVASLRAPEFEEKLVRQMGSWRRPDGASSSGRTREREGGGGARDTGAPSGRRSRPRSVDDPPEPTVELAPEPAPAPPPPAPAPAPAPAPEGRPGITPRGAVVGRLTRKLLGLEVGDVATLMHPDPDSPRSMRFQVVGVYETGVEQLDRGVYVDLGAARELLDLPGRISEVAVRVEREYLLSPERVRDPLAAALREALPHRTIWPDPEGRRAAAAAGEPYEPDHEFLHMRTWAEMQRETVRMMALQKWSMVLILGLLFVLTGFFILAILWVFVAEKLRDVGLLSALGASRASILAIFLLCGLAISVLGTALGLGAGELLCAHVNEAADAVLRRGFGLDLARDLFGLDGIPVARSWVVVILVVALANGTALLASLVPAWRAARLDPVETLRHE